MQTSNQTEANIIATDDGRESLNHVLQTGLLNEMLRQQLQPSQSCTQALSASQTQGKNETPISAAVASVEQMLNGRRAEHDKLHQLLSLLYFQLKRLYQETEIEPSLRKRQFVSHCGLILSSDYCIDTLLDGLRVRAFTRGIDRAIAQLNHQRQGLERVHIVYPACGPFAPLLLPLLAYYKAKKMYTPQQLRITLIDIQPAAVQTLEVLVAELGVKDYIRQICCIDALQYDPGERAVDIVVLEAMQHGLSREGFWLMARHFSKMLESDGILVPQNVQVTAVLNSAQREYVEQWRDAPRVDSNHRDPQVQRERTLLGEICCINKDSLPGFNERVLDEHTTLLECRQVLIPPLRQSAGEQTLLICTVITVYDDEIIDEYDSGITHPLADQQVCINFKPKQELPGDLLLNSGDSIKFYYRLNGLPGFMACWAPGDKHCV